MKKIKFLSVIMAIIMTVTVFPLYAAASAAQLPAPTVKTTTVSSTRVNVSWTKVEGAEKYAVYVSEEAGAADYTKAKKNLTDF